METQAQMDMASQEIQEHTTKEPVDDATEKQFLRDLHLFMKKRDTPIERIPNLGFKQIDLFLMYQTVKDLGGYHQVTAQQLWKQVYNRLGGNPRSTSAATCTRRHYEKLLLPYECHVKGISMNILPQHQPKHLQFAFNKYDEDGQRPAKRKLLSIPVRQDPLNLQSDPRGHVYPLSLHYPQFYHPNHAVLTPHVPASSVMTPHRPPAPQPQFSFHPYHLNSTERVTEPLEQLRYLAEQYKTTSGLTEPLNLSTKTDRTKQETKSSPASSFAPPSSSKTPKFLNKPSPLYTPHSPRVAKNDGCDVQDGDPDFEDPECSYPKATKAYIVDVKGSPPLSSPMRDSSQTPKTDEGTTAMAQKPSSPQSDFTVWPKEDREGSPEVVGPNLSRLLPRLPRENGGKMEIEIPISVLHNWLRLFGSPAMMHEANQVLTLPALDQQSGQRNCSDTVLPTNLSFHINPQHQSSAAEDLRRQRSLSSPTPLTQPTDNHRSTSQHPLSSFKPFGSILKNAASRDVYPCDMQDINKSYSSKATSGWDAYDKEIRLSPPQGKADSSPVRGQDFPAYGEEAVQRGREKSERGPSAVLMGNSDCMLQLTPEEVMKLKKIISNSS